MVVNISVLFISGEYKVVSNGNVFFMLEGEASQGQQKQLE